MLFSKMRYNYTKSPLVEVICQLRFPTIPSINDLEPDEFQEAIRNSFPRFNVRKEQVPPKVVNPGTPQAKLEAQPPVNNYHFISEDNLWKVNLTRDFISLSTVRYSGWEAFSAKLDLVLAQFIQIYKPTVFGRIGLRYVNAISRQSYGLTDALWDDLIQSPYLGILGEPDVDETKVGKSALDTEIALNDGTHLRIRSGPGVLGKPKEGETPETRFILDFDLSARGKLGGQHLSPIMNALHDHANSVFSAAITEELRTALGATPDL